MGKLIATKIKMKNGSLYSENLLEIDEIFIENNGWYKKAVIHDHVKKYPKSITVKTINGPFIIPAISAYGEKYVKSTPNSTTRDNLLNLPRE